MGNYFSTNHVTNMKTHPQIDIVIEKKSSIIDEVEVIDVSAFEKWGFGNVRLSVQWSSVQWIAGFAIEAKVSDLPYAVDGSEIWRSPPDMYETLELMGSAIPTSTGELAGFRLPLGATFLGGRNSTKFPTPNLSGGGRSDSTLVVGQLF